RATGASVTTVNMLAACFPLAMLGGFAAAGRLAHAGRIRAALVGGLGCLIAGAIAFTYRPRTTPPRGEPACTWPSPICTPSPDGPHSTSACTRRRDAISP